MEFVQKKVISSQVTKGVPPLILIFDFRPDGFTL